MVIVMASECASALEESSGSGGGGVDHGVSGGQEPSQNLI